MPSAVSASRESVRGSFALTALLLLVCLWILLPTHPGSWSVRMYKESLFCWSAPHHSRFGMTAFVEDEMEHLRARISALQDQKQNLLNSALSKSSQGASCDGECTDRQSNNSTANEHFSTHLTREEDNNTSFLFIGVLSVARNSGRRTAIRQTWMASAPHDVAIKFVLYDKEKTIDILRESSLHQDIIFVPGGNTTDYRSIVFKTFAFVQWVATNVRPNFVFKTDDDTYISCAALVAALKGFCRNPDCRNEGLYFGQEKHNGEVITEIDSKWSNLEYFQLTGLKEYMPYMLGGGYGFSFDVAETLHNMHSVSPLKLMPNEDATFGFWVMGMQLRHIGHPKVRAAAGACCFYSLSDDDAVGSAQHFQIRTWQDLCSGWLILHKVETEAQMAYLHYRLQHCAQDQALLQTAQQLVSQGNSLQQLDMIPKVKPFQIAMMTPSADLYHHWGHSDVSPWSKDGSLMLSQRVDVSNMQDFIKGDATVIPQQLGFVNFSAGHSVTVEITGWSWTYVTETSATSLSLGSRLQWLGPSANAIVYNDICQQPNRSAAPPSLTLTTPSVSAEARSAGSMKQLALELQYSCGKVFDLQQAQITQTLDRPIYAVSPDGHTATSFDFNRLKLAMQGPKDLKESTNNRDITRNHPKGDGLWLLNLNTGQASLLVSLHAIAQHVSRYLSSGQILQNPMHCFGHITSAVYNPEATRIVLKYHANHCGLLATLHGNKTYTLTIDVDGTNLWKVPVVGTINGTVSCGHGGLMLLSEPTGTHLAVDKVEAWQLDTAAIFDGIASACRFHPNNDRYAICEGFGHPAKLFVWDLQADSAIALANIARANWPTPDTGRKAMQPHFTPDGLYITFDSTHIWETGIQTYVVGVQHLQAGPHTDCNPHTSKQITISTADAYTAPQLMDIVCSDKQPEVTVQAADVAPANLTAISPNPSTKENQDMVAEQQDPQRLLLILALRDDNWLHSFIADLPQPELWQVHAWQAEDASTWPHAHHVKQALLALAIKGGKRPYFYSTAAGTHNNTQTITMDGSSLYDIDMAQLAHLLLPQPDPSEQAASDTLGTALHLQHEAWLDQKADAVHCLLNAAACKTHPLAKAAARSATTAITQDIQTEDFIAWLVSHAHAQDVVTVHMDLGQGREFELLQALLDSNALQLINHLAIRWHYQLVDWHLVLLWEQIFALLGLQYTSIT